MISVNLLPDIKMERINSQRRQRRIGTLSIIAVVVGISLPVLLIILWGGQKALLGLTQRSIDRKVEELKRVENLDNILTVQQQMNSLSELEKQRLYYTTLLDIIPKLMPQNAALSSVDIEDSGSVLISGTANSLSTVNDFVNILDQAKLVRNGVEKAAFSSVSLTSGVPAELGAAFEITLSYDSSLVAKLLDSDLMVGSKIIAVAQVSSTKSPETQDSGADPSSPNLFGQPTETTP